MVSIIIPYIDEHDYLAEALNSALGQHSTEIEIILVCNASAIPADYHPVPDETGPYTFVHEPTSGSAYARNAGLKIAKGEWVQFLDVDDLLHPDKIHHQCTTDQADVIVSPHTYLFLNGKRENSKWLPDDFWIGLLNSGLGSTSSMLWRRQALLDVGGWNTAYHSHQEYELLFRLASVGKKIIPNDHCETIVRQRKSGSITAQSKPVRVSEGLQLRKEIWDHLLSHHMDTPERYEAFRQYIFRQLRGMFRQDRDQTMAIYATYFSTGHFVPKEIHVPGYAFFYRLFGFYTTERLLEFMASHRNVNYFPFLPLNG